MSMEQTATASAATTGVTTGAAFFERALPIALTYGAFFAIPLPLLALRCLPTDVPVLPYLVLLEAVGLGTSHFFITLAVYFDAENLRYFASSWRSRAIYFGLPLLILCSVALSEALRTRENYPRFAFYFYSGV